MRSDRNTWLSAFSTITGSDYRQRFNPTCALAYLKVKAHSETSALESIKRYLFPTESSFAEYKCQSTADCTGCIVKRGNCAYTTLDKVYS